MISNIRRVSAHGKLLLLSAIELCDLKTNLTPSEKKWARVVLPYRIDIMENGFCMPLNRAYLPLGVSTERFIDPDDWEQFWVPKNELNLEALFMFGCYLFNDGTAPWSSPAAFIDYRIKLHTLMNMPEPLKRYKAGYSTLTTKSLVFAEFQ